MSIDRIIECVDEVKKFLRSSYVSFDVVGYNPSGDISKRFDVDAENIVKRCIVKALSDVVFVGEESGVEVFGSPKWVAIVDPVDGSTNFSYDIPWASISIGVAPYKQGVAVEDIKYAVVAEIFRDRMYVYSDGDVKVVGGKGRRSEPAPVILGYFESLDAYKPIEKYIKLCASQKRRYVVRSLGSAALDIIYVALGNAEIFIDLRGKLRNVDVAAAIRIAEALGAKTVEYIDKPRSGLRIEIDKVKKIKWLIAAYSEENTNKLLPIVLSELQQ